MNDVAELIIEVGINHQGSVDIAKEMIDEVVRAADNTDFPKDKLFFKFQKRNPEVSVPMHMWDKPRKDLLTGEDVLYIEYKRRMEFSENQFYELIWHSRNTGGVFVSVWDVDSVNFVKKHMGKSPYIKIPSPHLTNDTLIEAAIATKIPLIMSTGMSTEEEIAHAIGLVPADYGGNLVVLSCTSSYPCPDSEVNLNKMFELPMIGDHCLRDKYDEPRIGFSSHSIGPFPVLYALAFGAEMVEIHFTLDRAMPGSDHSASLEIPAIELIMREAQRIPVLRGDGEFHVYDSELPKRKSLRGY